MKKIRFKKLACIALSALVTAVLASGCAAEEKYPSGDITLSVAAGAGGDTDTYARILAQYMEEPLGVSVAITNNGDGSGTIACRDVHNADNDGYNAVFFHASYILNEISGITDLSLTDNFTIVSTPVVDTTSCIVANGHKFKDREDFFERARSGEEIIAAIAPGSYAHLACLQLEDALGANFKYVVVQNASERVTEMLADRIDVYFTQYSQIGQYCQTNDFICLGIMAPERNPFFEDIPTFPEQGIDITLEKVFYVAFPPETDPEIVNTFASALEQAIANPECQEAFAKFYVEPKYMSPEDSLEYLKELSAEYEKYADQLKGA